MKKLMRYVFLAVITILILSILLYGCGGDSTTTTTGGSQTISGVAAMGSPIAGATVTIKDKNGNKKSGITGSDGKYSIDVSGMTSPFLIRANNGIGNLFSIATSTGTANIHPLSDLISVLWFKAKSVGGTGPGAVFNGSGAINPAPPAADINAIETIIKEFVGPQIQSVELDDTQFHLITSPFAATGGGFDNVLDRIQISYAQNAAFIDQFDKPSNLSGGTMFAIPLGTDLANSVNPFYNAKNAINNGLSLFKDKVNSQACNLTSGDIQPYLTNSPQFIWRGQNADMFVQGIKTYLLGCSGGVAQKTVQNMTVARMRQYHHIDGRSVVIVRIVLSDGFALKARFVFNKVGPGQWLLSGDGEVAEMLLRSRVVKEITSSATPTYKDSLRLDVLEYLGMIDSGILNGPAGFSVPLNLICNAIAGDSCGNAVRIFEHETPNFLPYLGARYTIVLANTTDGTSFPSTTFISATPGKTRNQLDFPNFSGIGTHSINSVKGTTLNAKVFVPKWVTMFDMPRVELYNGTTYLGNDINATWTGTPNEGIFNDFSITIPSTHNGQDVTKAVLLGFAHANNIRGWGETKVRWVFE